MPDMRHSSACTPLISGRTVRGFVVAFALNLGGAANALGKEADSGTVVGTVVDPATKAPVELAAIALRTAVGRKPVQHAVTDARGRFTLEHVPFGDYVLAYGLVGTEPIVSAPLRVDAGHPAWDAGPLPLPGTAPVRLDPVEVTARREAFYNSIDRKVYHVGKDIQSATGSAADLLQNVPSVQVDIEGNVSLRGDANVLILVNGRTSTMMGRNRAAVLAQMPADAIERIEVITNPSAKYKPDGTAGIINLALKKKAAPGYAGSVRGSAGNQGRYNAGLTASFAPGKYAVSGGAAIRQDDRPRTVQDDRAHWDRATNTMVTTSQSTREESRPRSRIAQAAVDYQLDARTKAGASVNYNHRDFVRHATIASGSRGATGVPLSDYDRVRVAPEFERDLEFTARLEHAFTGDDHELSLDLKHDRTKEQEDNHYTNVYRIPVSVPTSDATLVRNIEQDTEVNAGYVRGRGETAKLEAGYHGERNQFDLDFSARLVDPRTSAWVSDTANTNRFVYDDRIHAVYGTYTQALDHFGFVAGVRAEQVRVHTRQVTAQRSDVNDYAHLYPSLHLAYHFTEKHEAQLNYSHRVHRPDGEDLNPFPHYDDPFNVSAGNPHLRPEDVHSVETGYHYQDNGTSYLATLYFRQRYNGVTEVSRYVDAVTLLTTKENLGTSRAGGLELGATTRLKDRLAVNFSGNVYRNEIDAANLGFASRRAVIAWMAKLNLSWDATKSTLVQLNASYTAKRLTPQGYRDPGYIANVGLRHNLPDKRTALIFTVSDVFNSLRERTHIETPTLRREITRRRSSSIFYAGVIYTFGRPAKKPKEEIQFDTTL